MAPPETFGKLNSEVYFHTLWPSYSRKFKDLVVSLILTASCRGKKKKRILNTFSLSIWMLWMLWENKNNRHCTVFKAHTFGDPDHSPCCIVPHECLHIKKVKVPFTLSVVFPTKLPSKYRFHRAVNNHMRMMIIAGDRLSRSHCKTKSSNLLTQAPLCLMSDNCGELNKTANVTWKFKKKIKKCRVRVDFLWSDKVNRKL